RKRRQGAPASVNRFQTKGSAELSKGLTMLRPVARADLARHLGALVSGIGTFEITPQAALPKLQVSAAALLANIAPARTATAHARARVGSQLPSWLSERWFDNLRVEPILAAPRFPRPMYEALAAYDMDWLVPGLGQLAATDFVTV